MSGPNTWHIRLLATWWPSKPKVEIVWPLVCRGCCHKCWIGFAILLDPTHGAWWELKTMSTNKICMHIWLVLQDKRNIDRHDSWTPHIGDSLKVTRYEFTGMGNHVQEVGRATQCTRDLDRRDSKQDVNVSHRWQLKSHKNERIYKDDPLATMHKKSSDKGKIMTHQDNQNLVWPNVLDRYNSKQDKNISHRWQLELEWAYLWGWPLGKGREIMARSFDLKVENKSRSRNFKLVTT